MKIKKTFFLSVLAISCAAHSFAQDNVELKNLNPYFDKVIISNNKIVLPNIPNKNIMLIGSDNQSVIDLNGNIHKPLVDKSVNLLFKVTDTGSQEVLEVPAKNIVVTGVNSAATGNAQPFVIPTLREWKGAEGDYKLSSRSKIVYSDTSATSKEAAVLLQEDIKKLLNLDIPVVASRRLAAKKGDITIAYSNDNALGRDGYRIDIGDRFEITAPQYAGKVFGTRTLLQLLAQDKDNLTIPKGQVRDYPTYDVRGFMLDVGRKFFTIDFLNDYVELMSYYKMSNFQIHLNDNGFKQYFDNDWNKTYAGFRLENTTYPGLASKDGHYTKQEFIDLQKKAARYGITIIPEIDVPAHSLAFAHMMPELGSKEYGMDHLDLNNPKSYEVVKNVFDEYTKGDNPVFIGQEVHVGTDEYDKKEAEKFRAFTDFIFKVVQDNGKSVRAWGALTHAQGKTPVRVKDVTLNMWYNGYADPIEMKKLGYPQISTPDGYLYIVPAAGYYYDYLNTNYLYNSWSPRQIGNVLFEKGDPIVRGGMFAVWNDIAGNGISEKDVHNRVFPAMQILSEKMWTAEDTKPSLFEFNANRKYISEAPGLNMRGYFGDKKEGVIFADSFAEAATTGIDKTLPIKEIGENYTVSFWVKPTTNFEGKLFESKNAVVSYLKNQGLMYQRDGYTYNVDIKLPVDQWALLTVTGDKNGTQFYLNDKLVTDNKPETIVLETKDKSGKAVSFTKVKTLVFPLEKVTFKNGAIADLKVYNVKLNSAEIADEFRVNKK